MTLTFDLEGQCYIMFIMFDYVEVHVKLNFLGPIVHYYLDLLPKHQCHILFSMLDYVGIHVKSNFLRPIVCEISRFKCICTMTLTFDLQDQGQICSPWLIICCSCLRLRLNVFKLKFRTLIFES